MDDAERYQKEFDQIMRETEDAAKRAEHLRGVDRLEQLWVAADKVGIDQAAAWQIIDCAPDPRIGLLALIDEVRRRSN